jgi:hypothetical protein
MLFLTQVGHCASSSPPGTSKLTQISLKQIKLTLTTPFPRVFAQVILDHIYLTLDYSRNFKITELTLKQIKLIHDYQPYFKH